jgi:Carbonic anhydrase
MDPPFTWEPFGRTQRDPADAAPAGLPRAPARHVLVLTCMDARIDPLRILGLRLGDAHVVRNAGAEANADALRSIRLSHTEMGTRRAIVVGHTDCGAHPSDEAAEAGVRAAAAKLRAALPALVVEGAVYDVRAGRLRTVQ